jgi:hypothetical protein
MVGRHLVQLVRLTCCLWVDVINDTDTLSANKLQLLCVGSNPFFGKSISSEVTNSGCQYLSSNSLI